jgi:signal transduction histidine kinase
MGVALRNREFTIFIIAAAIISACASILCQVSALTPDRGFALAPGIICLAGCLAVCALFIIHTRRRYRDIARLSAYLARLAQGERGLDIRDNAEGELSILRNEIYKVTAALTEQADVLAKDKQELAGALEDISHQLKTPLTALGVMADLLDNDDLPPAKRQDFLDNMHAVLSRMEWLVLALLKLARLDANAVDMKTEHVPLAELIEDALSPLLIPIEVREQTVNIICPDSSRELEVQEWLAEREVQNRQDAAAVCDREWTVEALGNILKNAVENTPAGGRLEISCGSNPLFSFITVKDSGPGINKEDMPRLFQRFYRGKNASRDSIGIGLAMSLAVMRKQGGDIEAMNAGGSGSAGSWNTGGSLFTLKFYHTIK